MPVRELVHDVRDAYGVRDMRDACEELEKFREWYEEKGKKPAAKLYYFMLKRLPSIEPEFHSVLEILNEIPNPYTRNATHAALLAYADYMFLKTGDGRWTKLKVELSNLKYAVAKKPLAVSVDGKFSIAKTALSEKGVKELIYTLAERVLVRVNEGKKYMGGVEGLVGAVLTFYFGWRPIEATERFTEAIREGMIDWKNRMMVIRGAKTQAQRILVWDKRFDVWLKWWETFAENGWLYREIITKNIRVNVEGVKVTAKTGRRTVITLLRKRMMRELGMEDRYILPDVRQKLIEWWVGHTTTPIQDIYTDETEFIKDLRLLASKIHYMPGILREVSPEVVFEVI